MPKRKSEGCSTSSISITSLDAALDMLACDTFTRLEHLKTKFENAAGVKLNEGVARTRWDEAVRRYWVMKSMDDLCCGLKPSGSGAKDKEREMEMDGEVKMEDGDGEPRRSGRKDSSGRALPAHAHPGAVVVHSLTSEEEDEWKRWTPRVNELVLVELSDDSVWPGKIIDKKTFFQGRTVPRGNHFYCVRIYDESMSPTVTIKSRLLPLHLRPSAPLLASTPILSAYNHASNPSSFDTRAQAREAAAAHQRTHPGVTSDTDLERIKAEKASWNDLVNWVMSERRVEKLRAIEEDRSKRLRELAQGPDELVGFGSGPSRDDDCFKKKRKTGSTIPLPTVDSPGGSARSASPAPANGTSSNGTNGYGSSIFGPTATTSAVTPKRFGSPSIRASASTWTPQRPNSPRKSVRTRTVYTGMGEYSPRGRGSTYTPPRILPSGDETAPYGATNANGSPAPTLRNFDFVSPLGPVRSGVLEGQNGHVNGHAGLQRKGSLDVVKEEPTEGEGDGWTVVQAKRSRRAGSAPCRDKTSGEMQHAQSQASQGSEGMTVDM